MSEKRAAVEALLRIWEAFPNYRLGQLLENAVGKDNLFYRTDSSLLQDLAHFAGRFASEEARKVLAGHKNPEPKEEICPDSH